MNSKSAFSLVAMSIAVSISVTVATGQDKASKESGQEESSKSDSAKVLAIVGGDIHTVVGPVIRRGTILVKSGKILEVGQSIEVPEDAEVIDAEGKTITPGFIAMSMSRVGIQSTPSSQEKLADALNPFDRNIKYALGVGITSGCVQLTGGSRGRGRRNGEPDERYPGLEEPVEEYVTESMMDFGDLNTSLCPCCGLPILPTEPITPARPTQAQPRKLAAIKLSYGDLDSMLLQENVFYSPAPGALSTPLQRHNWRRDLKKAREAIEEEKKATQQKDSKSKTVTTPKAAESSSSSKSSASSRSTARKPSVKPELLKLVKGEISMLVRADTVDEINDMVDLAVELGYTVIIEGGTEAWVVADKVGAAGAGIVYTPRRRRQAQPDREQETGSYVESPRIFQEKGIPFAVSTLSSSISMNGLAGRDLTSLPLEAAFAVRGGADEKTALQALTIEPAKMLGLEDRIGSLEAGKDADILILNGSPLDYRSYVEQAIVAGNVCYDREEDRVYPVFNRDN